MTSTLPRVPSAPPSPYPSYLSHRSEREDSSDDDIEDVETVPMNGRVTTSGKRANIVLGGTTRSLRCDSLLLLLTIAMYGLMCVCWGGIAFTHYQFVTWRENYDEVVHRYMPIFAFTYITMLVFSILWILILFTGKKTCFTAWCNYMMNGILTVASFVILVLAIDVQHLDHDYRDYHEYQHGILAASITQFITMFYFNVLAIHYDGQKPIFCGGRIIVHRQRQVDV